MKGPPYFAVGKVVKGFGRGSKDLGIPTANFPDEVVNDLPVEINTGIYYGWAKVDNGPLHKMIMNIGWNLYFIKIKKSMETNNINYFGTDSYGSQLRICIIGYIRPEMDFRSVDYLISTLKIDIDTANIKPEKEEMKKFQDHSFFQLENKDNKIVNGVKSH